MKAVILSAGEGKRMRPLSYTRPKVMLPLANKPILEHLVLELKKSGLEEFVFVVGYRDETIRDYFGDGRKWDIDVQYVTQREQLGTAHALREAQGLFDGPFLLVNGDNIFSSGDIRKLLTNKPPALGIAQTSSPERVGIVEVKGNRIMGIKEKMKDSELRTRNSQLARLANAGVYLFDSRIFEVLSQIEKSPRGEFELTDALNMLLHKGVSISYQKMESWADLGYPWDLLETNQKFLATGALVHKSPSSNLGTIEENVTIKDSVSIGEGTVIRSGSYIQGPVIIGRNSEIGPNSFIRPATSIGDNCHIGAAVEVKNSIIMNHTKIPHHNYIGDSVIGENVNFGAGTKIANLRLDEGEITVEGVPTKRKKLGAIIGDEVKTGINASINVGSLVGSQTFIGPGAVASGVIQPNSKVF